MGPPDLLEPLVIFPCIFPLDDPPDFQSDLSSPFPLCIGPTRTTLSRTDSLYSLTVGVAQTLGYPIVAFHPIVYLSLLSRCSAITGLRTSCADFQYSFTFAPNLTHALPNAVQRPKLSFDFTSVEQRPCLRDKSLTEHIQSFIAFPANTNMSTKTGNKETVCS